jgi:hypothetical protein
VVTGASATVSEGLADRSRGPYRAPTRCPSKIYLEKYQPLIGDHWVSKNGVHVCA